LKKQFEIHDINPYREVTSAAEHDFFPESI